MLPRTPLHWLSSAEVGAKFGVEQFVMESDVLNNETGIVSELFPNEKKR